MKITRCLQNQHTVYVKHKTKSTRGELQGRWNLFDTDFVEYRVSKASKLKYIDQEKFRISKLNWSL